MGQAVKAQAHDKTGPRPSSPYDTLVAMAIDATREATVLERTGRYREAFVIREQAHRDFLSAAQLRRRRATEGGVRGCRKALLGNTK